MKSPKSQQKQIHSQKKSELQQQPVNTSPQIFSIKPQRSNMLTKNTTNISSKESVTNIFSFSNRNSNNRIKHKTQRSFTLNRQNAKLGTSSQNKTYRASSYEPFKLSKNHLSQQLKKLPPVTTQNVLDDAFEDNLQNVNFYSQFKASVQQRKSLLFLKPYVKSGFFQQKDSKIKMLEGIEKLKSELYKCIHESQQIYTKLSIEQNPTPAIVQQNVITNRSAIQYLTQYEGNQQTGTRNDRKIKVASQNGYRTRNKQISLTVLREKLKSRYKSSTYACKMSKAKVGQETASKME